MSVFEERAPCGWRHLLVLVASVVLMVVSVRAEAEEDTVVGQRNVGFGPTAGQFNGLGGGLRLGTGSFGMEAFAAWQPVFSGEQDQLFDLVGTWQTSLHAYAAFLEPSEIVSIGVLAGYKYNDVLRHGGAVGGYFRYDLNRDLALMGHGGLSYFPDGESRMREELNLSDDESLDFPGPSLQTGVNLSLFFYL